MLASPSANELADLQGACREFAREAGELTLSYFGTDIEVLTKADDSPVTRADREAELLIRSRIAERFPDDGILGEEFEPVRGSGRRTWVVDPIDGTKSFVAGVPLYAVLVGVLDGAYSGGEAEAKRVIAGAIHLPALGESVTAARGAGAVWERPGHEAVPARVAELPPGAHAPERPVRVTTSDFADFARREPAIARWLGSQTAITRTWGDAYGYLLVATGRMDAMIDPIVSPWDLGPLPVIVTEAGGCYTDLDGRAVLGSSAIAASASIHNEILSARSAGH